MKARHVAAFLAVSALGLGSAQIASAADLGRPAPPPAPVAAPLYNWTGFYVGVHAGWVWSDIDADVAFLPSPAAFGADNFGYSFDADGGMLGGQIGFNWQLANWVIGLEADLSWTDVDGAAAVAPMTFGGAVFDPLSFHTSAFEMNWFGTVRGRLGFAVNNLLVYVTGGVAFADFDYATVTSFPGTGAFFAGAASETQAGWTLGGGFEWGFTPNWSVKAEYLYYDLGDTTITAFDPAFPGFAVDTNFDNTGHVLRIGLNYRFAPVGPVIARY